VPEADYLALKQELLDLRRQLQQQEEEQRNCRDAVGGLARRIFAGP
jgi:hypothetical protein